MSQKAKILIEGMSTEELLSLVNSEEYQEIIFTGEPVIFSAGSSQILGQFTKSDEELVIVLSHIEGGGEGVLLLLMNLFRKFAREEKKKKIEWIVHAVDCPKPNPKLPRMLELKGFKVVTDPIDGKVYKKIESV